MIIISVSGLVSFSFFPLFCLQHVISTLQMLKCMFNQITFKTAGFCVLLLRIIWYIPCGDGSLQAYVENGAGIPQYTAEILYSKSLMQTILGG